MTKTFRVSADAREWRLSVRAASTVPQRYYGRATKWQLRRLALLQGMRPLRQSTMDNCCQVLRNEMEGLPENDQGDTRRGCLAALSMVMSTYLTTCGVATLALQADQPGLLVFF
eukprot:jgi/Mesvir1/4673/Mv16837-RA.1